MPLLREPEEGDEDRPDESDQERAVPEHPIVFHASTSDDDGSSPNHIEGE